VNRGAADEIDLALCLLLMVIPGVPDVSGPDQPSLFRRNSAAASIVALISSSEL
jgi:hypothetical protein